MKMNEEIILPGSFVEPLLSWYRQHKRRLPWREDPAPYHVWISEIMLQQTRVEAVKPYYERFIRELPDAEALARVPADRLMKLWEGLGYYSRARNLQAAAKMVVEVYGGVLPETREQLTALPGIGAYTAGAIASIAYGQPVPAVDGNVLRVAARLAAYGGDIRKGKTKELVASALEEIYPPDQAGDFTQSLMELGATVCVPKEKPKCGVCPVSAHCLAYIRNAVDEYPYQSEKKKRRILAYTIFLLHCGEKIAVKKRKAGGLLGGLWELPNTEGHLSPGQAAEYIGNLGIETAEIRQESREKHIFTHIEWHMQAYRVQCRNEAEGLVWADEAELERRIALPAAFRHWDLHRDGL